jgi:RNA polymerase-interacting CarD/CdnL/TRCF family regulator
MGIRDWLGGKRGVDREIQEMMNPLIAWRLQHFAALPRNEDGYVRHYFQFLDKERVRVEFIVFYHETLGGLEQQHTAYRKAPEESYGLLSQRGPWSMSIGFLTDLGRTLPTNTQPIQGHHVLGVSVGSRRRDEAPKPAEEPKSLYQWQRATAPQPEPEPEDAEEPDLDGFEIGEILHFKPFHAMARIVDLEPFEGDGDDSHRFVIEFPDEQAELRVPVTKLRDLMSRQARVYTDEELAELDEEEDDGPILERHGFKVDEYVVYPEHGVGKILAIEQQDIAGARLELFVINFKNANMTLRVPTGKHQAVGMRRLADEL